MLNSLAGSGYFYDPTLREVTATFLPWLVKKVGVKLDDYGKARSLVDSLIDVAQNKANGTRARKLLSIHDEIDVERAEEAQAQANALLKAQQQAEAEKVAAAEAVRVAAEKAAKAAAGDEGDEGDEGDDNEEGEGEGEGEKANKEDKEPEKEEVWELKRNLSIIRSAFEVNLLSPPHLHAPLSHAPSSSSHFLFEVGGTSLLCGCCSFLFT